MKSIYGYFDNPEQIVPVYDPGVEALCPVCLNAVGHHTPDNPIKTISVMLEADDSSQRDNRCYFYRVHGACYDNLDEEGQSRLDWPIVDARVKLRELN